MLPGSVFYYFESQAGRLSITQTCIQISNLIIHQQESRRHAAGHFLSALSGMSAPICRQPVVTPLSVLWLSHATASPRINNFAES